jgi:hemolysin activation/secretion protein
MRRNLLLFVLTVLFLFNSALIFAQTTGEPEKVGELEKAGRGVGKEEQLREQIEKEKAKSEIEEKLPAPAPKLESKEQVFVKTIKVTGVTLLAQKAIDEIILPFENRSLTLTEMQGIADRITDAYRKQGFVTSRAYLPPQKITEELLEIRVVEGTTGEIDVKGNRYFKTPLYKKLLAIKSGKPFNYNTLQAGLGRINSLPDRYAKATIQAGKEPGTTDVFLDVKDNLPIHIGFEWDTFGSRYIYTDRFKTTLSHNNLLGRDDILTVQYQGSEKSYYRLLNLRYILPLIDEKLKLTIFAADSRLKLGKEYKDLDARGKSRLYSIYTTYALMDYGNLNLDLNFGFDYKDIFNFQSGEETSRDRLRSIRGGVDLDITDPLGRTLITENLEYGIPDIMAGLSEKDARCSRRGAGGKFVINSVDIVRLQRMPFDSYLLWKNQLQISPYILPAAAQFQIGGVANVRGYPPAEATGDRGYAMTWEWSFPIYLIPKDLRVPFSKSTFYRASRLVGFYDWANARLKSPMAWEEKTRTLRSAGCGFRFSLPEDFSIRLDFAWPLGNKPSDNKHMRTLTLISKQF